jgi:hypothetical protein
MDKAADLGVIIALVGLVAGIAILAGAFVGAYFFGKSKGQLNVARDPELLARITRIEQIVESTSIEIERITEGQRFTTKLLSERQSIEK